MGWEDGFSIIQSSSKAFTARPMLGTSRIATFSRTRPIGGVGSGRISSVAYRQPGGGTKPTYPKATFPEKIEATLPWSSSAPRIVKPQPNTAGDFGKSLAASLDNAVGGGGYLNLGNAVPWGMERMGVLAQEAARTLTGDDNDPLSAFVNLVGDTVTSISEVLAPVIDFIPNTIRDTLLNARAETYRNLVVGNVGKGVSGMAAPTEAMPDEFYIKALGLPPGSDVESAKRKFLADSVDLPDEVKRAIERDPNTDVAKALDNAKDGRRFTYDDGPAAGLVNAGAYLGLYIAEMIGTGGLASAVRLMGMGSQIPRVVSATSAVAKGLKGLHQVQKVALASGMGYFGVATTFDVVARQAGIQAAVEWFDRMNRTAIFSDNPDVQLVTGFSVNPIGAARMARTGTIKVLNGPGIVLDQATAGRFLRLYTHNDRVKDIMAMAYRTNRAGVETFVGPTGAYDTWGDATDRVVEFAGYALGDAGVIPKAEVLAFKAIPDGRVRTEAILKKYAGQVVEVITNNPRAVVNQLWNDWAHHEFAGPWNPRVAAATERAFVATKTATEAARSPRGLVVGYVDYLAPEGQRLARQAVDDLFARGDVTLEDLNMLNVEFPSIRGLYRDLVPGKAMREPVSRDVFDTVLERAKAKYDKAEIDNPQRVYTGSSPVLRPSSRTRTRDMAEALGTTDETIEAIGTSPDTWTPAQTDLVTAFGKAKKLVGDETLPPEVLWERVSDHVDRVTLPWKKVGEMVEATEAEFARVSDEIGRLDKLLSAGQTEHRLEFDRLQVKRSELSTLLSAVREPEVAYTQGLRFAAREAADQAAVARARRKIDAEERLEGIQAIDDEIAGWNTIGDVSAVTSRTVRKGSAPKVEYEIKPGATLDEQLAAAKAARTEQSLLNRMRPAEVRTTVRKVTPLDMIRKNRDGNWVWVGSYPPVPDALYAKIMEFLDHYSGPKGNTLARNAAEFGDLEIWREIAKARDSASFRKMLTNNQKRMVDRVTSRPISTSVDEYKAAWDPTAAANEDDFVKYLADRRVARDELLEGTSAHAIARAANQPAHPWAIAEAKKGNPSRLYQNPEAEVATRAARQNLARALDGGEDTFPAAREIIQSDPYLTAEAQAIADRIGAPLDELLYPPTRAADAAEATPGAMTSTLYREADLDELDQILNPRTLGGDVGTNEKFLATSPDLALGQGSNVGVRMEFDEVALGAGSSTGQIARMNTKPGAALVAAAGGGSEVRARFFGRRAYGDALRRFEIAPGQELKPGGRFRNPIFVRVKFLLDDLVASGQWKRSVRQDGTIVMERTGGYSLAGLPVAGPTNPSAYLREMVANLDETPILPGVPRAATELDQAIIANDSEALARMGDELERPAPIEPLHDVPIEAAEALARTPRPSTALASDMAAADVSWNEVIPPELWAGYDVAARGASFILHGKIGFPPRTPRALLTVLREIENGNAANAQIGVELAAEVQRAAKRILGHLVGDARKAQFERGVLGMGPGLNPYTWDQRAAEMFQNLVGKHGQKAGITVRDDALGIQYGLKQLPDDQLALEMSTVPGLAEELLAEGFQPWSQRLGTAHIRQAYNLVFGSKHNQAVFFEARGRFIDALAKQGVDAKLANAVWSEWKRTSAETKTVLGRVYASERNIPDKLLNKFARDEVDRYFKDYPSTAVTEAAKAVDYAEEFRKATSFTRRLLANEKIPMGDLLQRTYGFVAHNAFVTFYYPLFRFQMDLRYQALNWLEGPALYFGRSGLRRDAGRLIEGNQGRFSATRENLTHLAEDGLNDTGYPFSHARIEYAYKSMLKEQPDKLRGLMAEDPALFKDAIKRIAELDPELSATIKAMGHTPDEYLRVMDRYYKKVLSSADPEAVVRKEVMQDAMGDPTLAEVYGRIEDVNAKLMADARAVFFGNPARSNAERVLNSYLLYWPISYQIKATKWLLNIMFDRVGGLQTNAAGAYAMNELQKAHQDLLKSDPVYRQYIDEHPTLLFAAQMLFPMTPFSLGVSLSPLTRDVLFGTSKGILEIGPIYTITKLLPQVMGELYRDFHDVPGVDILGRMVGLDAARKKP